MARTGQPPAGTAASDTGTGAAGSTGFRGAVDVVVAIVVVVDVLVLVVAVGTAGCPPGTVVVVDAIVVVDDGPAVVVLVETVVLDATGAVVGIVASVDEVDEVSPTPSEFVVAAVAAVVDVVTAAADGADVVGPTVVDGRAGGPSGVTVVAGVVSAVVGVGVGASAAMAGDAAMKAVAATEERESKSRLDIAAIIHAAQLPGRAWTHFAQNCSFLVKRAVAKRLYAHLRPKRPVNEQRFGEFLGKPSRVEGI
jgi:hypothetical protein